MFSLQLMGNMRTFEGKATIAGVQNKAGDMLQERIGFLTAADEAAA